MHKQVLALNKYIKYSGWYAINPNQTKHLGTRVSGVGWKSLYERDLENSLIHNFLKGY